jgi:hypothetical protein
MLRDEVRKAVALVNERATRNGYQTPAADVTVDCHSFWRKGRGHG